MTCETSVVPYLLYTKRYLSIEISLIKGVQTHITHTKYNYRRGYVIKAKQDSKKICELNRVLHY